MQKIYLTPGPSQPYPRIKAFMDEAWAHDIVSISHRGKAFSDVYSRTATAVKLLMDVPSDYTVMFVGSATEAMERTVQGVVRERSHHFIQGEFAEKWFKIAKQLGKHPTATRAAAGRPFPSFLVPAGAGLVCITHNETSTGAIVPKPVLDKLVTSTHRPLVALDVVSSAPMTTLPWPFLDIVFFSVQKAFGLPAGLGVLIASPRAVQKSIELEAAGLPVGSYHSLPQLIAAAEKFQTPATPNVLGIYLLGSAAEDMLNRGVAQLRAENATRAAHLYDIVSNHAHMQPFVADESWRSPTVIVADVMNGNTHLMHHMADQRLVLGKGYKDFADMHVRIANFPAMDAQTFEVLTQHLRRYEPVL
jgi:phosphoserine aminotransferase